MSLNPTLKRRLQSAAVGLFAALLLAACSKATADNYARIEAGMEREKVHEILGQPDEVNGASIGPLSLSTEVWKNSKHVITITYTGGSVGLKSIQNADQANNQGN